MSISHTSSTFCPPRVDMPDVAGSADANVGSASEQVSRLVLPRSAASMAMAQQLPQTDTHAPTTFSAPNSLKPTLGSFPPTASLETMPFELLEMIVDGLDAKDLASLRKTSGTLYDALSDPVLRSKKMADAIPSLTHPKALNQLLTEIEKLPDSIRQKLLPLISTQIAKVLEGFADVQNANTPKRVMTDMKPVIKQFFDQACHHAPFDGGAQMAKAIAMNDTLRNERAGKLSSLTKLEPLFAKREAMIRSGMALNAPQWDELRYVLLERIMYFDNPSRSGSTQPAIQRFINSNNRVG